MNQFQIALDFYKSVTPLILTQKKNEWAIDPGVLKEAFHQTPIESAIWDHIRGANAVFYPQYPIDLFFADFANPVAQIAIECDGREFHLDKTKDAERDRCFHELGWQVYRIPGRLCITESDEEEIDEAFSMRLIREISEAHSLIRGNPKPRKVDEMMVEYLRYALEGKLGLIGI